MKLAKICIIQMYGMFFIILGTSCLIGHLFRIESLTTFGSGSDMAPPTGIGFIGVGLSHFVLAKLIHKRP